MNTLEEINTATNHLHAAGSALLQSTHALTSERTILLAEDDRSIRRYLQVLLERAGYTVITAEDGLSAMKVALSQGIDAVVTDAVMPHLGGHELCRFLRRHPKLKSLPVIILSGIEQTDAAPAENERADLYLKKPVRPQELTNCLEQLLAKAV